MDRNQIILNLKKRKLDIEAKFAIERLGLFGSYATNTQAPESDIDLVYELRRGKTFGLKEIYELEQYFKKILNAKKIDLVNRAYMNPIVEDEMSKTVIYV